MTVVSISLCVRPAMVSEAWRMGVCASEQGWKQMLALLPFRVFPSAQCQRLPSRLSLCSPNTCLFLTQQNDTNFCSLHSVVLVAFWLPQDTGERCDISPGTSTQTSLCHYNEGMATSLGNSELEFLISADFNVATLPGALCSR